MNDTAMRLLIELDKLEAMYNRLRIEDRLIAFMEGQQHERKRQAAIAG